MNGQPIYVKTRVGSGMEELWCRTQASEVHRRREVRFMDFIQLERRPDEPRRLTYANKVEL